jgi:hypothetical protein
VDERDEARADACGKSVAGVDAEVDCHADERDHGHGEQRERGSSTTTTTDNVSSDDSASNWRDELGLHFDFTVPLARYVEEYNSEIVFPYRRFQVQRVWRGERPQEGRYREFVQADFNIVGRESLPLRADAEVLAVVAEVMASMPLPPVELKVNSRPYVVAILDELEVAESRRSDVLQVIDKVDRKGRAAVEAELGQIGVDAGRSGCSPAAYWAPHPPSSRPWRSMPVTPERWARRRGRIWK